MKSASRNSTASRLPDASPAAIMLDVQVLEEARVAAPWPATATSPR